MKQNTTIMVFTNQLEAIRKQPRKVQKDLMASMLCYLAFGEQPDFSGMVLRNRQLAESVWMLMLPVLERSRRLRCTDCPRAYTRAYAEEEKEIEEEVEVEKERKERNLSFADANASVSSAKADDDPKAIRTGRKNDKNTRGTAVDADGTAGERRGMDNTDPTATPPLHGRGAGWRPCENDADEVNGVDGRRAGWRPCERGYDEDADDGRGDGTASANTGGNAGGETGGDGTAGDVAVGADDETNGTSDGTKESYANAGPKDGGPKQPRLKGEKLYKAIREYFNVHVHGRGIPEIKSLCGKRRHVLDARFREYGSDAVAEVIKKASESHFLNGDNNKSFVASFDWMMRPANFVKIWDGNYDDR